MKYGFHLFIDEAGDEGLSRVRPIDADGASEYFVLGGVLIRTQRYSELDSFVNLLKTKLDLRPKEPIHFSDLNKQQQDFVIDEISQFKVGLIAIVSNKRNMRRYRNQRCEAKHFEIVHGQKRPSKHNWFYNGLFRYMLERASAECARWTHKAYGMNLPIRIVFAKRTGFSYNQTVAYLYRLQVSRHSSAYFNNRGSIDWSVVRINGVEDRRPGNEPGLQLADCVASAIFRAIDQDRFESLRPDYLEKLAPRFIVRKGTSCDYGFKLLPDGFRGPLSKEQKRGLNAVGYDFTSGRSK